MAEASIRVSVWNEHVHERSKEEVRVLYPEGIHGAIGAGLIASLDKQFTVRVSTS